jgi:hypothetical protein
MEAHQIEINENIDRTGLPVTKQSEVFGEMIPEEKIGETLLLPMNVQNELESLQSLIKERDEELSKKDLIIKRLRNGIEILTDANEELEEEVEKIRLNAGNVKKGKFSYSDKDRSEITYG